MTSYSQNNEQDILAGLLSEVKDGRLLDIGAYVPDTFSNSRSLIDAGWGAVLVEPSPIPFTALLKHYAGHPKVALANAAVVAKGGGWADFYDSNGDAISSCSEEHKVKWEAGYTVKFSRFSLFTVTLDALLERFGREFDLLTLDVEGTNVELFRALPLDRMPRLKVICVEHDGAASSLSDHAASAGFRPVAVNGENLILQR